jgi:hypothetical protein
MQAGTDLSNAISKVKSAVEYDERGEYLEAAAYYAMSLPLFERSLLTETIPERRGIIAEKTQEYRTRLGDIETALATLSLEEQFPSFYCTFESFLNPGSLYVTKTSLVFVPKTKNGARCVVALDNIAQHEKIKTKVVVPGLRLVLNDGESIVFNSFASRDELISLLVKTSESKSVPEPPPAAGEAGSSNDSALITMIRPAEAGFETLDDLIDNIGVDSVKSSLRDSMMGHLIRSASGMIKRSPKPNRPPSSSSEPGEAADKVAPNSQQPATEPKPEGEADIDPLPMMSTPPRVAAPPAEEGATSEPGAGAAPSEQSSSAAAPPSGPRLSAKAAAQKYPEEEDVFHKLFTESAHEPLLEHFKCQLDPQDIFGTMFLTKKTLAFSIFMLHPDSAQPRAFPNHFSLSLNHVQKIAKEEPYFFSPKLISLTIVNNGALAQIRFTRMIAFDEAFYALSTLHTHRRSLPVIFGQSLKTILELEQRWALIPLPMTADNPPLRERVPLFLVDVYDYFLVPEHLHTEGLFVIFESRTLVDSFVDLIDEGTRLTSFSETEMHPRLVASLLRRFLSAMPVPLFSFEFYDLLVATAALPDTAMQIVKLQSILRVLPRDSLLVLNFVALLFHHLSTGSDGNNLTALSLAMTIAPYLIRHQGDISVEDASDEIRAIISIVQLLFSQTQEIFDIYKGDFV